jgi:MATE family multidrug resistance protein
LKLAVALMFAYVFRPVSPALLVGRLTAALLTQGAAMHPQKSYRGHAKAVLLLGLPLIGSHIAQMAINVADTMMMGWYGVAELAALVLAGSLFFVFFLTGSGFAFAVMPMVARAAGAGDDTRVRRVTRMGIWASAAYTALVVPVFVWSGPLFVALGQEAEISALAQDYLRILVFGMLPTLFTMVMKSYLSAMERTQIVFLVAIAGAFLNILLNYMLIFGNLGAPELGIRGAALASVVTQSLIFPALAVYAGLTMPGHRLFHRLWRPDTEVFGQVFRLGWPIGVTSLAEVGLFAASAVMMGWVGVFELAAHGIALQWASMVFMVHVGLSNVATIRAGNAMGRMDDAGLRRGALVVTAISLLFAAVIVALFLLVPEPLISAFLDRAEPARDEIIAIGVTLLVMAALFQLADAAQVLALGLLRGVHDAQVPMIFASISYWLVGLPAGYLLGFVFGLGAAGIWLGLVVGLTLAAVLMSHRFWTRSWFAAAESGASGPGRIGA